MAKKLRRGNGEGSIYQRKDGRWVGEATLPNRKRKSIYGKTRSEVASKLRDLQVQVSNGQPVGPERITLRQYAETWLVTRKATVKASTWVRYEQLLRIQVIPNLGHRRLRRIGPEDLERLYGQLLDSGLDRKSVV